MHTDFARGLAARRGITSKDVDRRQLAIGMRVEAEHTADPKKAARIALDHLAEDPRYYDRLLKCFPGEAQRHTRASLGAAADLPSTRRLHLPGGGSFDLALPTNMRYNAPARPLPGAISGVARAAVIGSVTWPTVAVPILGGALVGGVAGYLLYRLMAR